MQRKDTTTVPIGTEIEHNGQPLRITSLLSDLGWTSEVYQGELGVKGAATPVAIKVMKALDIPMARQLFEQEGLTLAAMMYHEEETNKEQRLSLKVAPVYYGQFEYNGMPCLVMEYIQGQKVPRLLEKGGKLPELEALTIAWHLYRTLDILHVRLKKTYIDLKFEDLWWVAGENASSGQLKLVDFGTLEDIKPGDPNPRGTRRDLLLAGVYLWGMLTGHMLAYSLGDLRERADPLLRGAEMSWGTRRLLRRLLHRNPALRPTNAAGVASELRTLVNFWEQPAERLFEIADSNISRALGESDQRGPQAQEFASRAHAALDLVRRKSDYDEERFNNALRRVENIEHISDYLERGRALFDGRTYGDARQVFEEGVHWSDDPAILRRWGYLAYMGQDVTPEVFDRYLGAAIESVDRMNQGNWLAAGERLAELSAPLASPGMQALQADCGLFASLEQAGIANRNQAFDQAAAAYRSALDSLRKLPDADFVQQEEVGDLRILAEEMERLRDTRGRSRQMLDEALTAVQNGDDQRAIELAWQAYRLDWQDQIVKEKYAHLLQESQRVCRPATTLRLAEVGLNEWPILPVLDALRNQSWLLWQADQALECGDYAALGSSLITLNANLPLAQPVSIQTASLQLLDRAGKQATQARDELGLQELARTCEALQFEGYPQRVEGLRQKAEQFQVERESLQRHTVDRLLARIVCLLDLNQPREAAELWPGVDLAETLVRFNNRLGEASQLLADTVLLAHELGGYSLEDIQALQTRLRVQLEADGQTELQRQQYRQQEQAARLTSLQQEWEQLQHDREWLYGGGAMNIALSLRRTFLKELQDRLMSFIFSSYAYLARDDRDQKTIRDRIACALNTLDGIGEAAWKELLTEATDRLQQLQNQLHATAQLFDAGELDKAAVELDRLKQQYGSAAEWQGLRSQVVQALAWRVWLQDHRAMLEAGRSDQDLLAGLRAYGTSDLPRVYRARPDVLSYLHLARVVLNEELKKSLPDFETPGFVAKMQFRREFEETAKMFEKDGGHAAA